jgi:hypothetical protein
MLMVFGHLRLPIPEVRLVSVRSTARLYPFRYPIVQREPGWNAPLLWNQQRTINYGGTTALPARDRWRTRVGLMQCHGSAELYDSVLGGGRLARPEVNACLRPLVDLRLRFMRT